jgi:hypothetical protein
VVFENRGVVGGRRIVAMAEGIALLSAYGDADSDLEDLDDGLADGGGSIVDYAHDEAHVEEQRGDDDEAPVGDGLVEVAGSPGVPGGGIEPMVDAGEELERDEKVPEAGDVGEDFRVSVVEQEVLRDFWPSPPSTPCPEALQAKFAKFLKLKEHGRNFNDDLRHSKGYRNPDFLQLAVMHQNIDEIGTCFDADVFNPKGYDKSDYADALGIAPGS